jgi:hypothetical protein
VEASCSGFTLPSCPWTANIVCRGKMKDFVLAFRVSSIRWRRSNHLHLHSFIFRFFECNSRETYPFLCIQWLLLHATAKQKIYYTRVPVILNSNTLRSEIVNVYILLSYKRLVLFIVYCHKTEQISTICPILPNKEKSIVCMRSNDSAYLSTESQ